MIAYAGMVRFKQARRRILALACVRAGRWQSYGRVKLLGAGESLPAPSSLKEHHGHPQ